MSSVETTTAAAAAIRASRTEILNDHTAATFGDVNWNHCTPEAKNGVQTILMGHPLLPAAGHGLMWPAPIPSMVLDHAANLLRAAGWVVDYKPPDDEPSAKRPKRDDLELRRFQCAA
jgi:hypothetical protein